MMVMKFPEKKRLSHGYKSQVHLSKYFEITFILIVTLRVIVIYKFAEWMRFRGNNNDEEDDGDSYMTQTNREKRQIKIRD